MASGSSKLNPFQIEDVDENRDNEKWEGDFYDEYDEDYFMGDNEAKEVRGLLGAASKTTTPSIRQRRSKQRPYSAGRIVAVLGSTAFCVWIVWLGVTREDKQRGDDELTKRTNGGPLPNYHHAVNDNNEPIVAGVPSPLSYPDMPQMIQSPTVAVVTTTTTSSPTTVPTMTTPPPRTSGQDMAPFGIDTMAATHETTTTEYDDFVPAERVPADALPMPGSGDNNNDDWDNSKPLRPYDPKPKPLFFVVLGERHSGVDYILNVLENCYGDEHRYGSGYNREAPWFQTYDETDVPFQMDAHMHYRVVLILATRNPYDWVQDMYHKPVNLGDKTAPLLKDFVMAPWSYPQMPDNTTNGFCQFNFVKGQVSPCLEMPDAYRFPDTVPVYELDATTQMPYQNIVAFRAAKIRHWMLNLTQSWGMDPMILPMDDINAWTAQFAQDLLNRTTGEEICWPPINNVTMAPATYQVDSYASSQSTKFVEWMNANVDWEMEQKIGYSPIPSR
jgi:hypothetical protein